MYGGFYLGVFAAVGLLITLHRLGIRKFLGYGLLLDALVTAFLVVKLGDSVTGTTAAVVGGTLIAIYTLLARRFLGYEKLTLRGWQVHPPH
jgi:hypothetical protein